LGGPGSGNRSPRGARPTCEGQRSIDLRYMLKGDLLRAGAAGSLSWNAGGEPCGSIRFSTTMEGIRLQYSVGDAGSDRESIDEFVGFSDSPQRLGGLRRWFICPRCFRRCVVLYGGRLFRCRKCNGLAYESQHEEPRQRVLSQVQKLRQRLGGSGSMDESFPPKPPRMHSLTYERLRRKGEKMEQRLDALDAAFLNNPPFLWQL
jgi:hypothetical protein